MQHGGAVGGLYDVGHVAGGGDVGDRDGHAVVDDVQDFADQYAGVQSHGFARFDIEFQARLRFDPLEEGDQQVGLVIGAGDMVAAAEVQPFETADMRHDAGFDGGPGAFQRQIGRAHV